MAAAKSSPIWHQTTLRIAAVYNLVWGAWVVLWPAHFFSLLGMSQPAYPSIWQGMGMVIGVYGLGYFWASFDPVRHWPIIAVGALGKLLGPIGYLFSVQTGTLDPAFGWMLLTNDLIWWIPFALILLNVHRNGWPLTD